MKLTKVKYPITNPLVFAIVMKDAELCRELIERILPGRKISKIRFPEPPSSETEKTIIPGLYAKSVRLDVLFEDGESWNDIEMQVLKQSYLPSAAVTTMPPWTSTSSMQVRTIPNCGPLMSSSSAPSTTMEWRSPFTFFEKYDVKNPCHTETERLQ